MIGKTIVFLLAGYLLFCAFVFVFQRKMLYMPGGYKISEQAAANLGLRYWPSPEKFQGFTSLAEPADPQGTVIVFPGNAGAAYHRDFYLQPLNAQNLRVILAEYPGYGGRVGSPSESLLVADALETIRLAHQAYSEPLYLWGESLGCGVVAGAVHQTETPIQGLVLFLAWDTLPDLAQTHYWYLPARWLVKDRYNSVQNLKGYPGRIAVVLAGQDEVVPVKHGLRLYESIETDKELWLFENARHNYVPIGPELVWWREVVGFVTGGSE